MGARECRQAWRAAEVLRLAIEAVLTLRLAFSLPLRQAEGFLNSLFRLMGSTSPRQITRRSCGAASASTFPPKRGVAAPVALQIPSPASTI